MNDVDKRSCVCGGDGVEELHSCPYDSDVNGDDSDVCNCCEFCVGQCADNI